jgi:3-deoxy-D-manno-octulosonic-acid transferase
MRWSLDLLYALAAVLTAPIWFVRLVATGKLRSDWRGRFGWLPRLAPTRRPCVLIHAVSVGEVNAIRLLVERLADHPHSPKVVISTTTNTGFARAASLFRERFEVVRYPLDFSFAVSWFLDAIQPDLVVLTELEVWPNFIAACGRRSIVACVINGRLTERSLRRFRWVRPLISPAFASLSAVAAQSDSYAERFAALGVPRDRLTVTGTMKWDTAEIANDVNGAVELAEAMGIDRSRPLIVAGSTAPDEHMLLHAATPPGVQLMCAPRKPEWFEQAARDLPGCVRRSGGARGGSSDRFLLDTIGELRAAYALADLVVVGRSFGELHGSDMMEPIALGKATIVGPAVADFQEVVDALRAGDGLVQTTREALSEIIRSLLSDSDRRRELADNGRRVIRAKQGATDRHVLLIAAMLGRVAPS